MKLLLIGGIPSSGSTFLIHLLSGKKPFLCLPETGLFTQGRLFVDDPPSVPVDILNLHVPWVNIKEKVKQMMGWDILLEEYEDNFSSLMKILEDKLEGAGDNNIIVEKTPENIFAFEYYLRADASRKVLITLRDLENVCFSLIKRKFSMLEAIIIWFAHAFQAWLLLNKYPDQVLSIDYDKLCSAPEDCVIHILDFCNIKNTFQKELNFNVKRQYQWMINQSSWFLSSRYWSKEINVLSNTKVAKWRLGTEFDALVDSIVFKGYENTLIKPRLLNAALQDKSMTSIYGSVEKYRPINVISKTLIIESLVKSYPISLYSSLEDVEL